MDVPDVVDHLGRTWVWSQGDLYTHDSMTWPLSLIRHTDISWPSAAALRNPNYRWCDTCKATSHD